MPINWCLIKFIINESIGKKTSLGYVSAAVNEATL